jgi:hypothetical protein
MNNTKNPNYMDDEMPDEVPADFVPSYKKASAPETRCECGAIAPELCETYGHLAPETRWVGGQLVKADSALQIRLAEVVAERDELLAVLSHIVDIYHDKITQNTLICARRAIAKAEGSK